MVAIKKNTHTSVRMHLGFIVQTSFKNTHITLDDYNNKKIYNKKRKGINNVKYEDYIGEIRSTL